MHHWIWITKYAIFFMCSIMIISVMGDDEENCLSHNWSEIRDRWWSKMRVKLSQLTPQLTDFTTAEKKNSNYSQLVVAHGKWFSHNYCTFASDSWVDSVSHCQLACEYNFMRFNVKKKKIFSLFNWLLAFNGNWWTHCQFMPLVVSVLSAVHKTSTSFVHTANGRKK